MRNGTTSSSGSCDAFKKEELMRRLQAGHALSDLQDFGFIVFTPPTMQQVDQIVELFLKDYKKNHGFFWTHRSLLHLQKLARRVSTQSGGSGGLSRVASNLASEVTKAISLALDDCVLTEESDILLVYRKNALQALITMCSSVMSENQRVSQSEVLAVLPHQHHQESVLSIEGNDQRVGKYVTELHLEVETENKEFATMKEVEELNLNNIDDAKQWKLQRYFELLLLAGFAFALFPSLFTTALLYLLLPVTVLLYLYIFQPEAWALVLGVVDVLLSMVAVIWPIVKVIGFRGILLLIGLFYLYRLVPRKHLRGSLRILQFLKGKPKGNLVEGKRVSTPYGVGTLRKMRTDDIYEVQLDYGVAFLFKTYVKPL